MTTSGVATLTDGGFGSLGGFTYYDEPRTGQRGVGRPDAARSVFIQRQMMSTAGGRGRKSLRRQFAGVLADESIPGSPTYDGRTSRSAVGDAVQASIAANS